MTLDIHIVLSLLLLLIPSRNLYVLYTEKKFIPLARKVRFWTPAYFSLMGAVAFTGFVLSAFLHNFISVETVIMIASLLIIMILEIKKQKKIRPITSKEIEAQKSFILFARKKYIADIALIMLSFGVGFIL